MVKEKSVLSYKKKGDSFYISWRNMKVRCLNKNHPKYYRYGGRGIVIDPSWLTIDGFAAWALKSGWEQGLTLDRINNDGDYEPNNCRWVTLSENSKRRSNVKIFPDDVLIIKNRLAAGEDYKLLAKEYGVCLSAMNHIKNGRKYRRKTKDNG